jgi:glycosyltransferase involved in cell wall biosynthesis
MKEFPSLVSVVIPTYNRAKTIEKTINSILNQTYTNIEIIIIDDCSKDNTEQIINEKFSNIKSLKYIKHEINKGGNAARNTGIYNSRGEYIAFLDSDDEWLNTKIEKQMNKMIKNKKCGLVYTYCANVDLDTNKITSYFGNESGKNPFEKLLCENFIGSTSSILCTKDALLQVGMFDETLPSCQDWELYIRIANKYDIEYVNEPLLRYYVHGNSITGNCNRAIEGHVILLERVLQLIETYKPKLSKRNVLYYHYRKRADIYLKFRLMKKSVQFRLKSVFSNPFDVKNNLLLLLSLGGKNFYNSVTGVKKNIKK